VPCPALIRPVSPIGNTGICTITDIVPCIGLVRAWGCTGRRAADRQYQRHFSLFVIGIVPWMTIRLLDYFEAPDGNTPGFAKNFDTQTA